MSLEPTSVRVVDEDGAAALETEPDAMRETRVGAAGAFERANLAAAPPSSWLASGLKPTEIPAISIEPPHAKAAMVTMTRNRNDSNDARSLARAIRSGWFKAVRVTPVACRDLGTPLVVLEAIVDKLRDHETEISGQLRPSSPKVGRVAACDVDARNLELSSAPRRMLFRDRDDLLVAEPAFARPRLPFSGEQPDPKSGAFAGAGSSPRPLR